MSEVTVVGGGLAGLAAACALAEAGHTVQVLERRPYVGGRASSYEHPGTGEIIDNCQHVLIGRCTNLIDLYRRLGAEGDIRWYDQFTFLEPGGRASVLRSTGLPAPFHSALSFLKARAFSIADKIAIARGLSVFFGGLPEDSGEDFGQWLARHGQTARAIERFWRPVLVSALNEEPERISVHYAAKVFRESFLSSAQAGRMGIPSVPLSALYGKAIDYVQRRGGEVHLRTSVDSIDRAGAQWQIRSGGRSFTSNAVILALSFEAMTALLPNLPQNEAATALGAQLQHFEHSPITGIHLWHDREITALEHAVLLDSPMQWIFNKSKLQPNHREGQGSYVELVVSASRALAPMQRQQIVDLARGELGRFFPEARSAKLLKAAVVKEVRATYSVRPMLDMRRSIAWSPWPAILLAGDWTATGWPATMEGAVRSGYRAAEALTQALGDPRQFVVADLPDAGLMRLARKG